MAKLLSVIEVDEHKGTGTQADPHRTVRTFYSPSGEWLMADDQWDRERAADISRKSFAIAHELHQDVKVESALAREHIEATLSHLLRVMQGYE